MSPSNETLEKLNKDALLRTATSLSSGSPCYFIGEPITQFSCTVFIIEFPGENKCWAARIPEDQEYSFLEISVKPLEFLAHYLPSIPAPRLHSYFDAGVEGNNPVGVAYMLLDWIEGKHMPVWSLTSPTVPIRDKLLDQLAGMMLDMLSNNKIEGDILFYGVPDGTPKHTPVTTTVWLTESIDRALRRNFRRKNTSTAIDYLIQRSMIPRYVVSEHENSPWVVMHPDLHNANIIIDDEYNIKGLIDWDAAFALPLQKCAVWPKLLETIPGAIPPHIPEPLHNLDFSADKAYFLSIFSQKEQQRTGKTDIAKLIETSSERNFFEMSHHCPTVHPEFVARFCGRSRGNLEAALREVEAFLGNGSNAEFEGDEGVVEVRREIERILRGVE